MRLAVGLRAELEAPAPAPASAPAAAPAACGSRETRRRKHQRSGREVRSRRVRVRAREGSRERERGAFRKRTTRMARSGRSAVSFEGTHLFRLGLRRGLGRVRLRRRSRSRDRAGPRRWASPRPAGETRTPPREPPTREEARRRGGGAMSSRTSSRFARARVRKRERGRPRPRACRDNWIPRARLCTPSDASDAGVTRADGWEAKKSAPCSRKNLDSGVPGKTRANKGVLFQIRCGSLQNAWLAKA